MAAAVVVVMVEVDVIGIKSLKKKCLNLIQKKKTKELSSISYCNVRAYVRTYIIEECGWEISNNVHTY